MTGLIRLLVCCLLVFPLAAPAAPRMVDVTTYGAVGDGETDDTRALQAALQPSATDTVVTLPRGRYVLTQPLVLHNQSLVGDVAGGWPSDTVPLPQLIIKHHDGPAITMKAGASLHGVLIEYPEQVTEPAPPAVLLSGIGVTLSNVKLQNPYDGILCDQQENCGRLNIENVFVVNSFHFGVEVSRTWDVAALRNVEIWCPANRTGKSAGFVLGYNDDVRLSNCFSFNTGRGFLFRETEAHPGEIKGTWGLLSNCSTDYCPHGIEFQGSDHSVSIAGGLFWSHMEGLLIRGRPLVRITGCEFRSNGESVFDVRGSRALAVSGCSLTRVFDRDIDYALQIEDADNLAFSGNVVSSSGDALYLGAGVRRAAIAGNVFDVTNGRAIVRDAGEGAEIVVQGNAGVN